MFQLFWSMFMMVWVKANKKYTMFQLFDLFMKVFAKVNRIYIMFQLFLTMFMTQYQIQGKLCFICVKKILCGLRRSPRLDLCFFVFLIDYSFSIVHLYRCYYTIKRGKIYIFPKKVQTLQFWRVKYFNDQYLKINIPMSVKSKSIIKNFLVIICNVV